MAVVPPLRTARLDLEPLVHAHAEEMFPILADAALYEYIGGAPPASVAALAETYARWEARRDEWLNWIVRERESGVAIGHAQATLTRECAYVAWVIGTTWQRRGFGSEVARALVAQFADREVRACVNPRHVASQRVAERAGLIKTDRVENGEDVWVYVPATQRVREMRSASD